MQKQVYHCSVIGANKFHSCLLTLHTALIDAVILGLQYEKNEGI